MTLQSSLLISSESLTNVSAQLALVANNVANAATPGYASETLTQRSLTAGGLGIGVQTGLVIRTVNQAIQSDLFAQNGVVANLETTQSSLQPVNATLGTVGQGNDISSLVGSLQDSFITLSSDPSNAAQQSQVVSSAQALASSINGLSMVYSTARQGAQNDLVAAVGTLNAALASIGTLSDEIVAANGAGRSTADFENQRDLQLQTVSSMLAVNFVSQSNGDVMVETSSGLTLPTHGTANALSATNETIGASTSVLGAVTLAGTDINAQLSGGRIGADLTLGNTTLPTYQSELDEFSKQLATRFSSEGLTLFTRPDGTVPSTGTTAVQSPYVGFASEITVNPSVVASPSLVRDGTNAVTASSTGAAAFTPNPANGPAGFSTLISNVLTYSFGSQAQAGVDWPAVPTSGLGAGGTLSAPYSSPTTLSDFASSLISVQAQESAATGTQLTGEQAVQGTLQTQLSAGSGVSIDSQMSNMLVLENAYGANAKLVSAVQSMFTDILNAVQ